MNRRSPFSLLRSRFVFKFEEFGFKEFRFEANPEPANLNLNLNTNLNTNREERTKKCERC